MNVQEWKTIVGEVHSLFGASKKWENADRAYVQVTAVDYGSMMSAVRDTFNEGRATAPSMSEMVQAARARSGRKSTEVGQEECSHPRWAIVEEVNLYRIGICAVCRIERKVPKEALLTDSELQERRLASQRPDPI